MNYDKVNGDKFVPNFFTMAQNWGDKLVGSIGWLLFGILVFIGSFVVLFYSEGRADLSLVADKAISFEDSTNTEDLAYITGELHTPEYLGDDLYVDQGDYLILNRTVEMYSWVEETHTEDEETFYSYDTKWIEEVPDSSQFDSPRRHENPEKLERSKKFVVDEASVGGKEIDLDKISLPGLKALELSEENVTFYDYGEIVSDGDYDYIFNGFGTFQDPDIGDLRIKYSVLGAGERATAFGRADGDRLEKHHGEQENKLYRVFWGTKDDAKATLTGEYKAAGMAGKVFSFLLMWLGLSLILKPLSVSLELVPFLGKLGKGALAIITFILALILTWVASFIFSIVQSIVGLVILVAVVIAIGFYVNMMKQPKPKKS